MGNPQQSIDQQISNPVLQEAIETADGVANEVLRFVSTAYDQIAKGALDIELPDYGKNFVAMIGQYGSEIGLENMTNRTIQTIQKQQNPVQDFSGLVADVTKNAWIAIEERIVGDDSGDDDEEYDTLFAMFPSSKSLVMIHGQSDLPTVVSLQPHLHTQGAALLVLSTMSNYDTFAILYEVMMEGLEYVLKATGTAQEPGVYTAQTHHEMSTYYDAMTSIALAMLNAVQLTQENVDTTTPAAWNLPLFSMNLAEKFSTEAFPPIADALIDERKSIVS